MRYGHTVNPVRKDETMQQLPTWREYAEKYGKDALPDQPVNPDDRVPEQWITDGTLPENAS